MCIYTGQVYCRDWLLISICPLLISNSGDGHADNQKEEISVKTSEDTQDVKLLSVVKLKDEEKPLSVIKHKDDDKPLSVIKRKDDNKPLSVIKRKDDDKPLSTVKCKDEEEKHIRSSRHRKRHHSSSLSESGIDCTTIL